MKDYESYLLTSLDKHDNLIEQYKTRQILFSEFIESYGNFYWENALDGHESNSEQQFILRAYKNRIEVHRLIAEEILSKLCSEDDAVKVSYQLSGRIGAQEAERKLLSLIESSS